MASTSRCFCTYQFKILVELLRPMSVMSAIGTHLNLGKESTFVW